MKNLMITLILLFTCVFAEDPTTLFNRGNQYYQQGDYEQAIDQFQGILDSGYESGELYFNLGNSYYKINELGKARINYERALQFIDGDEALNENLRILRMRLVDQIEPPPQFFLNTWWNFVVDFFSIQILIWIVVIVFWLMIFSLVYRIYHSTRGHALRGRSVLIIFLILLLSFTLISIQKVYNMETERFAVIMAPSVTLLAEPKAGGTEVFVLHEGTKVKIEREAQDWFEIRLIDGKTGWLAKQNLEII